MAGTDVKFEMRIKGPIFDGRARHAADAYLEAAVQKVSATGKRDVDVTLRQVLQHPTGYYQAMINTRELFDAAIINDGRVIYGPWLEGISRRNASTRFKGYHTFRLVAERLRRKAPQISKLLFEAYVRRMQ